MRSAFKQKYGIPRQPRLVHGLKSEVVFGDEFNNPDAVRGLEEFSHIWLIWGFSDTKIDMTEEHPAWKPTVRPPRLGGDIRKGVFATRSPYRPNSLGMSAVKLLEIRDDNGQLSLIVEGADLLDGTPIYDIKPDFPEDLRDTATSLMQMKGLQRALILRLMLNFQMTYLQKLMKSFARHS